MEGLEEMLKDLEIIGKCPETGEEANFEYIGTIVIEKPKKQFWYNLQCSDCGGQHYLHEIKNPNPIQKKT